MKKTLAFSVITAMCISLFGCGTPKTAGGSGENGEELIIHWMPQNDGPVDAANSPIVAEYEKKFGCKFEFIYVDRSKSAELLNIKIAGGEVPDVMRLGETDYRNFIRQGTIVEIPEELIKSTAPTVYQLPIDAMPDAKLWNIAKEGDKIYGIPLLNTNGQYHSVNIWRDDWLRNVGIDKIPETLEEAERAFYALTKNDPDGNGRNDTYAMSANGIKAIFHAYGGHPYGWWDVKDGKLEYVATFPEMKQALIKLNQYYKDGLIDPEFITGENKGQHFAHSVVFWNGRIGFSSPGMPYHVNPPFSETQKGGVNYSGFKELQGDSATFTYGPPIKGPEGKFGGEHWGMFPGDYIVMGKYVGINSPKMKKILEINEALASDLDFYNFSSYGREGIDYEIDDTGSFISKIETEQRISYGLSVHGISYFTNADIVMGRFSPQPQLGEFQEKWGNFTKNYENKLRTGVPSSAEYNMTLRTMSNENYVAFISGQRPIEEFDAFVEEMNNAGLSTMRKEANEWYAKINSEN